MSASAKCGYYRACKAYVASNIGSASFEDNFFSPLGVSGPVNFAAQVRMIGITGSDEASP